MHKYFVRGAPGLGAGSGRGGDGGAPARGDRDFRRQLPNMTKRKVGCTIFQSTTMSASQLSEVRVDNWSHSAALYARFGSSDLCITDEIKIP